ncbi:vck6 protein [Jeremy Point nyavirus]|uniref:Vck6 protein n=1 Tax=Jeremy Point nyavirus TaxID=2652327 RepID=A0AAE6NT29_9MONO|nr:vck6 protein [Jeremy Point nyavirus]QFG01731.1 vck6 protein [Jeremy Point nyavirus]
MDAVKVLLVSALLGSVAAHELRCMCPSATSGILYGDMISAITVIKPGPHCEKKEIIATLKKGGDVCLASLSQIKRRVRPGASQPRITAIERLIGDGSLPAATTASPPQETTRAENKPAERAKRAPCLTGPRSCSEGQRVVEPRRIEIDMGPDRPPVSLVMEVPSCPEVAEETLKIAEEEDRST